MAGGVADQGRVHAAVVRRRAQCLRQLGSLGDLTEAEVRERSLTEDVAASVAALVAASIMAQADNPAQPRSMTLMAGPIDTSSLPIVDRSALPPDVRKASAEDQQSFRAALGMEHLHVMRFEHAGQRVDVADVVIHDQHLAALEQAAAFGERAAQAGGLNELRGAALASVA